MHREIVALCLMLSGVGYAGPNQNAKLFVDFVPETPVIDSIGGCPVDSTITVAVRMDGASKLYDYQFFVRHDTASLRFVSGKAGSDHLPAMLERNGGSIFFTAKRSIHDSTRILVGCSLLDDQSSQCVSDSGIVCLLNFKHKIADTTVLSIDSVFVGDCDEKPDTGLQCFSGTILPFSGVAVARIPVRRNGAMPDITLRNGVLDVDFRSATGYVLTAVSPLGRQLGKITGMAGRIRFNCRDIFVVTNRTPGGLVIIRLRWQGNEVALPVVM